MSALGLYRLFQEPPSYQGSRHGIFLLAPGSGRLQSSGGSGGIGFIPSFPFCKNMCTDTPMPDPQSAADRAMDSSLQAFYRVTDQIMYT